MQYDLLFYMFGLNIFTGDISSCFFVDFQMDFSWVYLKLTVFPVIIFITIVIIIQGPVTPHLILQARTFLNKIVMEGRERGGCFLALMQEKYN